MSNRAATWQGPGIAAIDPDVEVDIAIVGSGIAGAALAWRLAESGMQSIAILEREVQPGYHSTGRSAAMFVATYGTPTIRALTRASRDFYTQPPSGFTEHPVLTARGALYVAWADQAALLDQAWRELAPVAPDALRLTPAQVLERVPVLRDAGLVGAILETDAQDIDVHGLHYGFLRGCRRAGGKLLVEAELERAERRGDGWWAVLADGRQLRCRVIVDAAGAWADGVAERCGVHPVGLQPRRRSAFTFAPPPGLDCTRWPAVVAIDESFYFKPDAGLLLGSPANADPVMPQDVLPEDLDIALGIERIQNSTTLAIPRPQRTWAGLRSFVDDGELVVGWDPVTPGFFWLAAQGGYGIQTAAAVGALAMAELLGRPLPAELVREGVDPAVVDPRRFARQARR